MLLRVVVAVAAELLLAIESESLLRSENRSDFVFSLSLTIISFCACADAVAKTTVVAAGQLKIISRGKEEDGRKERK